MSIFSYIIYIIYFKIFSYKHRNWEFLVEVDVGKYNIIKLFSFIIKINLFHFIKPIGYHVEPKCYYLIIYS